ncbi:MAG: ATP-dependent DNA helicase, partial [Ruminococcaceae bacterium]|nr:ATP-dependent DNA helicase [Oscillospiraceae bacterium]
YMRDIYDRFTAKYPSVSTIVQKKDMSYSQRREFIEFFADDRCVLRVGFCVLGGSFSEGIDLPGDRLIGTVIFGVGLPGISNEQNIIKEYYDFKGCDGYDFAYTYPGFNNVLQAAGRVIRSENDKGIIIFADERYAEEKYKRMMPERYRGLRCYADLEDLAFDIKEFWRNG